MIITVIMINLTRRQSFIRRGSFQLLCESDRCIWQYWQNKWSARRKGTYLIRAWKKIASCSHEAIAQVYFYIDLCAKGSNSVCDESQRERIPLFDFVERIYRRNVETWKKRKVSVSSAETRRASRSTQCDSALDLCMRGAKNKKKKSRGSAWVNGYYSPAPAAALEPRDSTLSLSFFRFFSLAACEDFNHGIHVCYCHPYMHTNDVHSCEKISVLFPMVFARAWCTQNTGFFIC